KTARKLTTSSRRGNPRPWRLAEHRSETVQGRTEAVFALPDCDAGAKEVRTGGSETAGLVEIAAQFDDHRHHHDLGPPLDEVEVRGKGDVVRTRFARHHGVMPRGGAEHPNTGREAQHIPRLPIVARLAQMDAVGTEPCHFVCAVSQ